MPATIALSAPAIALLLRHMTEDDVLVDDANRDAHYELARAGLMIAGHSFRDGRDSFYAFTQEGFDFACALKSA